MKKLIAAILISANILLLCLCAFTSGKPDNDHDRSGASGPGAFDRNAVTRIEYQHGSSSVNSTYTIDENSIEWAHFNCGETETGSTQISRKEFDSILNMLEAHHVQEWNGFAGIPDEPVAGSAYFSLQVYANDREVISTYGESEYPDGYDGFCAAIISFLEERVTLT